jgi:hypothetical protein
MWCGWDSGRYLELFWIKGWNGSWLRNQPKGLVNQNSSRSLSRDIYGCQARTGRDPCPAHIPTLFASPAAVAGRVGAGQVMPPTLQSPNTVSTFKPPILQKQLPLLAARAGHLEFSNLGVANLHRMIIPSPSFSFVPARPDARCMHRVTRLNLGDEATITDPATLLEYLQGPGPHPRQSPERGRVLVAPRPSTVRTASDLPSLPRPTTVWPDPRKAAPTTSVAALRL